MNISPSISATGEFVSFLEFFAYSAKPFSFPIMTQNTPQPYLLQLLDRDDYRKQYIVPFEESLPPLAASSIRVRSSVIALTTNNITYARLGDAPGLNWFDAHPLPFTSGPYSDATKYGRISAWGTGEVIESTEDSVPVGTQIWGYLPIASLPVDKQVGPSRVKNVIEEITEHRKHLWPVYNKYFVLDKEHAESEKFQAYSALMKVLFETSYSLNRMCFSWDPAIPPVNPMGLQPPPSFDTWNKERADLADSTVVIMPASSKTAFAFAYALRYLRPKDAQPRAVIGITSEASKGFVEETGLYDQIVEYQVAESASKSISTGLNLSAEGKVVLVDFGARPGFKDLWRSKLDAISRNVLFVRVASAIDPTRVETKEEKAKNLRDRLVMPANSYSSNASVQRDAGMMYYGEAEYLGDLDREFDRFIDNECVNALKLIWGKGMRGNNGVEGGWERVCSGNLGAAEGLVYRLP